MSLGERLRAKLAEAARTDRGLAAFGARRHRYRLGPPLPEADLGAWEGEAGVALPTAYRTFLSQVGHGGAGPYYGLERLPEPPDAARLQAPSLAGDAAACEAWGEDYARLDGIEDVAASNALFDRLEATLLGGLLPLCQQGCGHFGALVLTGPVRGRIAYATEDFDNPGHTPFVPEEPDFLAWYERWLDEVIDGTLLQDGALWFGHLPGGPAETLVARWQGAAPPDRRRLLQGLAQKATLPATALDALEAGLEGAAGEEREALLMVLAKHDVNRVRDRLLSGREGLLPALKAIHWHAKELAAEAVPLIRRHMAPRPDAETFRFACYAIQTANDARAARDIVMPVARDAGHPFAGTARHTLQTMKLAVPA